MDDDSEFEVTAEMLIHDDVDDEGTLAEEEALQCREEVEEEVDDLQKESEMPIEQLLALYGYGGEKKEEDSEDSSEGSEKGEETRLAGAHTHHSGGREADNVKSDSVRETSNADQTDVLRPAPEARQTGCAGLEDDGGSRMQPLPHRSPVSNDHGSSLLLCNEQFVTDDDGPLLREHKLLRTNDRIRMAPRNSQASWTKVGGLRRDQYSASSGTVPSQDASHKRASNKSWLRPEVPERRSMRLMTNDEKVMEGYFASLMDDGSDSDEEYLPNEDWKAEIKVGPTHQAVVPDRPACSPYPDERPLDNPVWNPKHSSEKGVSQYLEEVSAQFSVGSASQDNEQALRVLQRCNHDVRGALKSIHQEGISKGMQPWTEEECRTFEAGLRTLGKDFFQLRKQIPTRTVKELVQFYYIWKKTERYDAFMQQGKIGKKKILCPPGQVSDFMDRFLDVYDTDASDLHYGTTTMYAEVKKETS